MKLGVIALLSKLGSSGGNAPFGSMTVSFPDARICRGVDAPDSKVRITTRSDLDGKDFVVESAIFWPLSERRHAQASHTRVRRRVLVLHRVSANARTAADSFPYTPGLDVNAMDK